jgi:hypothetical protein
LLDQASNLIRRKFNQQFFFKPNIVKWATMCGSELMKKAKDHRLLIIERVNRERTFNGKDLNAIFVNTEVLTLASIHWCAIRMNFFQLQCCY